MRARSTQSDPVLLGYRWGGRKTREHQAQRDRDGECGRGPRGGKGPSFQGVPNISLRRENAGKNGKTILRHHRDRLFIAAQIPIHSESGGSAN
jgi:hypothetical protein